MSNIKKECAADVCPEEIVKDLPCGPQICIQTTDCPEAVVGKAVETADEK